MIRRERERESKSHSHAFRLELVEVGTTSHVLSRVLKILPLRCHPINVIP